MDSLTEYRNGHYRNPFIKEFSEFKGCVMPLGFQRLQEKIYNMSVREQDVWVVTFPRSGTTWTQEMVWMILNDLNFEKGLAELQYERSPFLEMSAINDVQTAEKDNPEIAKMCTPRMRDSLGFVQNKIDNEAQVLIKSHLPLQLLPKEIQEGIKKPKIIYVARNPKDAAVSFFHHEQRNTGYTGTLEMYCELFLAGKVIYSPYWQHVLPFWNRRDDPNILFIKYEDMSKNISNVIRKVANFVNKPLSDTEIDQLADHLSFENMKKNPSTNMSLMATWLAKYVSNVPGEYMRKGKVGSYKESLSPELIHRFDTWIAENTKGTGLEFS